MATKRPCVKHPISVAWVTGTLKTQSRGLGAGAGMMTARGPNGGRTGLVWTARRGRLRAPRELERGAKGLKRDPEKGGALMVWLRTTATEAFRFFFFVCLLEEQSCFAQAQS